MNCYGHSGDLGDIIYALPTIKASGGGVLYLLNRPERTTFPMTHDRVNAIRPLLLQQTYIKDVIFAGDDTLRESSINGFRDHCCQGRNLADAHLATHGLQFSHRNHAWLNVDIVDNGSPVVFSRSARYHNDRFPWHRIVENYGQHAVFLGTQDEYAAFVSNFGHVPYVRTSNLLQAARIIAGAQLFVGNQSCLHAIAEGLKRNILLEVCPSLPNCIFDRMGVVHAWDDNFELPTLSFNLAVEPENGPMIQGIDDAVCINLRRRPERWKLFQFRAKEAGLGFFRRHDAIDGDNLDLPNELKSHKGTYGCLHSHADVYRKALKKGVSNLFVVEDDCVFTSGIKQLTEYLAATIGNFSWIHLGGARDCYPHPLSNHPTHIHVASVLNTHAYIIDKDLMSHYVKFLDENPFPKNTLLHSDRLLIDLCLRNSLHISIPLIPIAHQDKLLPPDVQWGVPQEKVLCAPQ